MFASTTRITICDSDSARKEEFEQYLQHLTSEECSCHQLCGKSAENCPRHADIYRGTNNLGFVIGDFFDAEEKKITIFLNCLWIDSFFLAHHCANCSLAALNVKFQAWMLSSFVLFVWV